MRFQFSLAAALICVLVLAIICTLCKAIPVRDTTGNWMISTYIDADGKIATRKMYRQQLLPTSHPPTVADFGWRLVWAIPLGLVAAVIGITGAKWLSLSRSVQKAKGRRFSDES